MKRKQTKAIKVGNLYIGGNYPILIQSMTNIKTSHTEEVIEQIKKLENAGCQIIRVSVLDDEDADAIRIIKNNINIPLVADIHFDYKLALKALENGIDKLRINPGNIGSIDKIKLVVEKCKEKNVPIRIGVNSGSIEKELFEKYGSSSKALVESALKHVKILESLDFTNIVISVKSSDMATCTEAYENLSEILDYPLHIGITEAGTAFSGTVKSSIGLGILLSKGIGDTIRVSLSTDPIEEIKVAKEILSVFNYYKKYQLISCPTCGRTQYNMLELLEKVENYLENNCHSSIKVAIMGCVVNGPGEAKNADIGIAGGKDCAVLFKEGKVIKKIPEKDIFDVLINEIKAFEKENH